MPLIRIETNHTMEKQQCARLCTALSAAAAEVIGKPEAYVQVIISAGQAAVLHGAAEGAAAFVDVRSIGGLNAKVNNELCARICRLLAGVGIPGERVYLNFADVPATHWGHDGATFG